MNRRSQGNNSSNNAPPWSQIQLIHNNTTCKVALVPGIPSNELRDIIIATFELSPKAQIKGVRDMKTGKEFPLSVLSTNPSFFSKSNYSIVLSTDDVSSSGQGMVGSVQLSSADVASLMKVFQRNSRNGMLNLDSFIACFNEFLSTSKTSRTLAAKNLLRKQLENLFLVFDRDGNGLVDSREFLSGLSVLCAGERDEKIRAAFNLYDADGDGFIDRDEMESYLSSVFSVVAETSPEVFEQHGVTPAELGSITAAQCFAEADKDGDGRISWPEFVAWYSDSGASKLPDMEENKQQQQRKKSTVSTSGKKSAGMASLGSLEHIRKVTGLGSLRPSEVFSIFARHAHQGYGYLDQNAFNQSLMTVMQSTGKNYRSAEAQNMMASLFRVFDVDNNGKVDFEELTSGLSVLTKGTRDEKIAAAFALFDENGDGIISLPEMTSYLTNVFRLLYETSPGSLEQMGVTPEELGAITAEQCFIDADTDHSGGISLEEFKAWFAKPSDPSTYAAQKSRAMSPPSWVNISEVRRLTALSNYAPEDVFEAFALQADDQGMLNRQAFTAAFQSLIPYGYLRTSSDKEKSAFVIDHLFDIMDVDHNGVVDFAELASGLSVLSGGNSSDKVHAIFQLYDFDGDGYITPAEMQRYLTSMFRVLAEMLPNAEAKLDGATPEELAEATTKQCFLEADTNRDNKLDFKEFESWYLKSSTQTSPPPPPPPPPPSSSSSSQSKSSTQAVFKEIRNLTGLGDYHVEDVFEEFASAADGNGWLSRESYMRIMTSLRGSDFRSQAEKRAYDDVVTRFFNLFDEGSTGKADFSELASGLSVLAGGNRESKAEAAFVLYDYNGDGYISHEELSRYLRCVFLVMYAFVPGTQARVGGLSVDQVSLITADEIMENADLNHDGRLSLEEFAKWYSNTGPIQEQQQLSTNNNNNNNNNNTSKVITSSSNLGLAQVRRLLGLNNYSVEDVFEMLAVHVDESGILNRQAFNNAFASLIRPQSQMSPQDRALANDVITRLFDLFDADHSGGVDFSELSSGLSILCGGSDLERARAAFALYDVNDDGFISLDEMRRYLKSVYLIVYETEGGVPGFTPEQLADATSEQIFTEADLNHDGRLSFDEFAAWLRNGSTLSQVVDSASQLAPSNSSISNSRSLDSTPLTIADLSKITNLGSFSPEDAFEEYAKAANRNGELTRQSFILVSRKIADSAQVNLSKEQLARRNAIIDRLFDIMDKDSNGLVDFVELSAGLSVLCGGSRDSKVRSAFELYDANGDGVISLEEMRSYLESVYRVLYATNPGTREEMGVSEEELARITAEATFLEADLDQNGCLSFDEFKRWYESSEKPSSSAEIVRNVDKATEGSWVNIEQVQRLTGINRVSATDMFDTLAGYADEQGNVNKSSFTMALEVVAEKTGGAGSASHARTNDDRLRFKIITERLFDVLDTNKDNMLEFSEIASGISILCAGSIDSKVEAAFSLFDYNNDGVIDKSELTRYLVSIYSIMFEFDPSMGDSIPLSVNELAKITANEIFDNFDVDHNDVLSLDEFKAFYRGQTGLSSFARIPEQLSIEQVRKILGLEAREPHEIFTLFAKAANENGLISRQVFNHTFFKILGEDFNRYDRAKLVLSRVFDIFDADRSGFLSFDEVSSGLSILCHGSRESKARVAFDFFDVNGDGFISDDELERYLVAVYRLMFGLGHKSPNGYTPEVLAHATSQAIFDSADLNRDGMLSFEEFQRFYSYDPTLTSSANTSSLARSAPTSKSNTEDDSWLNVEEVRRLTNLGTLEAEDVFELFAGVTGDAGTVSYADFVQIMNTIALQGPKKLNQVEKSRLSRVINILFRAFDTDQNGVLDFAEIASGLSVLCGGKSETKAEAAFSLYDENGDGFISPSEMERYLRCVFTVMYETQPGTFQRMGGVPAADLAKATAAGIFQEADVNKDGRIDFAEFSRWFSSDIGQAVNRVVNKAPENLTMTEIRHLTGLENLTADQVFEQFAKNANSRGELNRSAFYASFNGIVPSLSLSSADTERLRVVLHRLFDVFDSDGNGVVDFQELASGLSILARGDRNEKVQGAFELFDLDGDGYIELPELVRYLTSIYLLMFETNPDAKNRVGGVSAEELAQITAEDIFVDADLNHDGKIDFSEFKKWMNSGNGKVLNALEEKAEEGLDFDEVRRLTRLDQYNAEDAFEVVAGFADSRGNLNRQAFFKAFEKLSNFSKLNQNDQMKLRTVITKLFRTMDTDGDQLVDFNELASGLSVLCSGSREDRVAAAFQLYDVNGDGYISLSEMTSYLTSVFKVLYETVPGTAESVGVSAQELAAATAETAFAEADLNGDGKLSYEEFAAWFNDSGATFSSLPKELTPQQKDFDEEEDNQAKALARRPRSGTEQRRGSLGTSLPLQELRRLTKLGMYEVDDVLEFFASVTGSKGSLTLPVFIRCFEELITQSGGHNNAADARSAMEVVTQLFTTFDEDNNAEVDFKELASGLSVLCAGKREDKVRAAFDLYDLDHDGYLDIKGMTAYMTSIFKVLYKTSPDVGRHMNMPPEQLAAVTAKQAFAEADVNKDGRLSFDEFLAWYKLGANHQ